ncbi:parallel beta helix pectate lyase-like protein [Streptomyces sp. 1114.5]|uniref:right-handed parallel beta-helix repeat-containing protein n=1 Tax=Streptomyces sp. 1114.5 TaxID=1938830 RepID=UPI000EB4183E|nr:right-handed parallel beta-helix repeat-containing protein [Streptomyces sp. 1114.5]RKT19716.1 parallel beta helix pectate lyase-like protein [Streptomyces sp. 1114.5]
MNRSARARTRCVLACLAVLAALGAMTLGPVAGAATAAPASPTLLVPRDFPTIQAAVDAAASGSTVVVQGGTYTEQVVVSGKDLELVGADAPTVKAPATLTTFGTNTRTGQPVGAVVRVAHGAHVRMVGFTVSGPIPCGPEVGGITALQAATLDLADVRVTDMQPPPSCPADQAGGRGVVYGLPPFVQVEGAEGSTAFGRVSGVRIARYQFDGINLAGPPGAVPPTRVTVLDSEITGGAQIPVEQFGIAIGEAVATVTGNTVADSVCTAPGCGPDPINDLQSGGIFAGFTPAGTSITGNHVSGADIGIYQFAAPNCCRITANVLTDNRLFGVAIQDGDGATHHNVITGGQVGIGVIADAVDTTGTLHGDVISRTTVAPVRELQCCGFRATAVVKPD